MLKIGFIGDIDQELLSLIKKFSEKMHLQAQVTTIEDDNAEDLYYKNYVNKDAVEVKKDKDGKVVEPALVTSQNTSSLNKSGLENDDVVVSTDSLNDTEGNISVNHLEYMGVLSVESKFLLPDMITYI
jgi:hypothetical protein